MSDNADRQRFEDELGKWAAAQKRRSKPASADPRRIGQMQGLDRALVLQKSLLANTAHLLSCNPNADCALGVLLATTILSDNPDGCSTVSVGTVAKLLSRHPRNVMDARQRCKDAGVIGIDDRPGRSSQSWPIVSPALADNPRASVAWLLNVLAGERPAHGRPRTEKPLHIQASGASGRWVPSQHPMMRSPARRLGSMP
jgi:hypothetical protein